MVFIPLSLGVQVKERTTGNMRLNFDLSWLMYICLSKTNSKEYLNGSAVYFNIQAPSSFSSNNNELIL
jgi:hypothetical protein